MSSGLDASDDEFLVTACQAFGSAASPHALDALGWWDVLGQLDDPEARGAAFAVFRAQGRELADTPALSGLCAQPFLEGTAVAPGAVLAAIDRWSPRRGRVWTVVGDPTGRQLLFADPDLGAVLVDPTDVELVPSGVPGRLAVHEARVDLGGRPLLRTRDQAASAQRRSTQLGRLASAAEMLGSAERTVALGVAYATDREQFGQPIGTFQAVRHLLAWARADCVAVEVTLDHGIDTLPDPPARFDEVVKALAGRNARRVCERTLQVFGGIGFTAEHVHHHHHSRVRLLDALLGSSTALTRELGRWLRVTGSVPDYPNALLTGVA